jgi:hypothetical protein
MKMCNGKEKKGGLDQLILGFWKCSHQSISNINFHQKSHGVYMWILSFMYGVDEINFKQF